MTKYDFNGIITLYENGEVFINMKNLPIKNRGKENTMLQKKKGFTLVEVLVVILISGLVLSMVATAMIFITSSSGELIHHAEDIDMAKNIEKYLRDNWENVSIKEDIIWNIDNGNEVEFSSFAIDENGNLIELEEEKTVFSNTGLTNFEIKNDNDIIKCYMKFDSGKEFEFTLAIG